MTNGTACTHEQFAEVSSQLIHALPRSLRGKDVKRLLSRVQGQGDVLSRSLSDMFEVMLDGRKLCAPPHEVWRAVHIQPFPQVKLLLEELSKAGITYSDIYTMFDHSSVTDPNPRWVVLATCKVRDLGCPVRDRGYGKMADRHDVERRLAEIGSHCPANLGPYLALEIAREPRTDRPFHMRVHMENVPRRSISSGKTYTHPSQWSIENRDYLGTMGLVLSTDVPYGDQINLDDEFVFVPHHMK